MTEIRFDYCGEVCSMRAKGHAEYAELGKDIVCAGVTAITYALAGYLVNTGKDISVRLEKGDAEIIGTGRDAFLQAQIGLEQWANEFPDNVMVFCHSRRKEPCAAE